MGEEKETDKTESLLLGTCKKDRMGHVAYLDNGDAEEHAAEPNGNGGRCHYSWAC